MPYTPTNWVDGSTPLNRTNMKHIEDELVALDSSDASQASSISTLNGQVSTLQSQVAALQAKKIPVQTTLPVGPVDGQEVIIVDSTTATTWHWHMRFNGATGTWLFIGGTPATAFSAAAQGLAGGWNPYVPQLTVPFTGGYRLQVQGLFTPATTQLIGIAVWWGGTFYGAMQQLEDTPGAGYASRSSSSGDVSLSAGTLLSVACYTNNTANVQNALLMLTPRAFS